MTKCLEDFFLKKFEKKQPKPTQVHTSVTLKLGNPVGTECTMCIDLDAKKYHDVCQSAYKVLCIYFNS